MLQHFGDPTDEEKRIFTRVLQGHIAIDVAIFPNGTTGLFLCACFLNITKGLSALQDT
jgi:Xaa-Pro aminopeptidase